ncbi:hypothetical protein GWI33_021652 [Rhynchophorus ferrugineus]|uniref:Uncharacterized protein n=1 Tax=Rhynchophorus ferrugineus TaxID=354439 RepID=A0A834IVS2_RHYFE|nr:hypothetical protein GWI33_021652 [Rhynchophorus ferrugineus]
MKLKSSNSKVMSFTSLQIQQFSTHIRNCLEHPRCLDILKTYLRTGRMAISLIVLTLWEDANKLGNWNVELTHLIDEIDDFDSIQLNNAPDNHKLMPTCDKL